MSEGSRPGGLTALAVLNFVFGGLALIGFLILALGAGAAEYTINVAETQEGVQVSGEAREAMSLIWLWIILGLLTCGLLIASGVGYLGQKKFLGQKLGNAYGVLGIVLVLWGVVGGMGFTIMTIVRLVYPVLTLVLLNTTFKNDFINP